MDVDQLLQEDVIRVFWKTDEHVPFHDMRAIELAMMICEEFVPHILPAGSDGMDHFSISDFDKDPGRLKNGGLQEELDEWYAVETMWNSVAPNAERLFITGNHEDRLRRYLWRHPELHNLTALSPKNLYRLDELNIKIAPGNEIEVGNVLFHHGTKVSQHSAYSGKGELELLGYSRTSVTGHVHRGGRYFKTTRNGIVQAIEGFCLCSLSPGYVTHPNWQQGVVLSEITSYSEHFELVPFTRDGRHLVARWRGREYRN